MVVEDLMMDLHPPTGDTMSIALTLLHMDAVEADVIMAEEVATMIAGVLMIHVSMALLMAPFEEEEEEEEEATHLSTVTCLTLAPVARGRAMGAGGEEGPLVVPGWTIVTGTDQTTLAIV